MPMSMRRNWYQSLRHLAYRNEPIEVMALNDPDAETEDPTDNPDKCRTRLLAVKDDESLVVALPVAADKAWDLRQAAAMDVLTINAGQRWIGRCRVLGPVSYQLNEGTKIPALRLGPADHIRSAQRRSFFRAQTTANDIGPVRLELAEPSDEETLEPIEAQALNLSGGGIGLLITPSPSINEMLSAARRYLCRLLLPDTTEPLAIQATLVHTENTSDRGLYLGLAFHFDSDIEQRQIQDQLVRFTTELERQRLQRMREM